MKMIKNILMLVGTAVLLMGCATADKPAYGGMGNDTEIGTASGSNFGPTPPPMVAGPVGNSANGSISRSNPFGAGGTMPTAN